MSVDINSPTFATPATTIDFRADGSIVLQSRRPLGNYDSSIISALRRHADADPGRPLAVERGDGSERSSVTFAEARTGGDALGQAFLDLGLSQERPIMILSGNSVEHLLVMLGSMTAGIPVIPTSVAYSLMSRDHERLRAIAAQTAPGLVFAEDAQAFKPALDALESSGSQVLVSRGERSGALRLDDLLKTPPRAELAAACAAVGPDTIAKLLFTSGSTGTPKGVITTHGMLCSNQAMIAQVWPFLADEPPVMVDWLPWSHTFGGNFNLNLAISNGGTIHIDDGRPAPPLFGRTVEAIRQVRPTVYFNVPAGYALLAPALESDPELARRFFSRLRFMFYAAAALPDSLALRLRRVAEEVADHPVPLTSAWGATETAPGATVAHFADAVVGCMGVPLPGTTIKLAPVGDKLEIRVQGPNVTPGYYGRSELTANAFDEDGFYKTGDAVRLVDVADPDRGLLFDGRIAEDFKLVTGTWVRVGALRTRLLDATRVLTDAVVCGEGREFVGALAWVNQADARNLLGTDADVSLDNPHLARHLAQALSHLNSDVGSAGRVERILLQSMPADIDAGEITDKGYINQRACQRTRAADVERLYASEPDPAVIVAESSALKESL